MPKQRKNKRPAGYLVTVQGGSYFYLRGITTEREARLEWRQRPITKTPAIKFTPYYTGKGPTNG